MSQPATSKALLDADVSPAPSEGVSPIAAPEKSRKIRWREIIWDSLNRDPAERRLISKIDFFILTWAGLSYFSKNLNSGNVCKSDLIEIVRYFPRRIAHQILFSECLCEFPLSSARMLSPSVDERRVEDKDLGEDFCRDYINQ